MQGKRSVFSLDMISHITFLEFCAAVVRDCGGNLMPSQRGMTAVWQMKMPGGVLPARHLETG